MVLSEIQQKYARKILEDIKKGILDVVEGKTCIKLHQDLKDYIEGRKADKLEEVE